MAFNFDDSGVNHTYRKISVPVATLIGFPLAGASVAFAYCGDLQLAGPSLISAIGIHVLAIAIPAHRRKRPIRSSY